MAKISRISPSKRKTPSRAAASMGSVIARHVDIARPERPRLARVRVEGVAPDAASVVGEQVDRDRRLRGGRADAVDVVARRQERIEVAAPQLAALDQLQLR